MVASWSKSSLLEQQQISGRLGIIPWQKKPLVPGHLILPNSEVTGTQMWGKRRLSHLALGKLIANVQVPKGRANPEFYNFQHPVCEVNNSIGTSIPSIPPPLSPLPAPAPPAVKRFWHPWTPSHLKDLLLNIKMKRTLTKHPPYDYKRSPTSVKKGGSSFLILRVKHLKYCIV